MEAAGGGECPCAGSPGQCGQLASSVHASPSRRSALGAEVGRAGCRPRGLPAVSAPASRSCSRASGRGKSELEGPFRYEHRIRGCVRSYWSLPACGGRWAPHLCRHNKEAQGGVSGECLVTDSSCCSVAAAVPSAWDPQQAGGHGGGKPQTDPRAATLKGSGQPGLWTTAHREICFGAAPSWRCCVLGLL